MDCRHQQRRRCRRTESLGCRCPSASIDGRRHRGRAAGGCSRSFQPAHSRHTVNAPVFSHNQVNIETATNNQPEAAQSPNGRIALRTSTHTTTTTTTTTTTSHVRPLLIQSLAVMLAAAAACCCLHNGALLVGASPPIDYFVYTSQLATAKAGTQNVASILPTLKSIYLPDELVAAAAPGAAFGSSANETSPSGQGQQQRQQHLAELSDRVMNLVSNSSHQHDSGLGDLETTQLAWSLMEKQALVYMENRVNTLRPFIQELLIESQVSKQCNSSINLWLNELVHLKHWATLMWNAWGQFPMAGVFQGSYTDLGSYKSCMAIEDNDLIGEPQYCTLDFQPLVPSRPRFHSIFKRILDYDPSRQQLTSGDFQSAQGDLFGPNSIAHGAASSRFSELYGNKTPYRHSRPQLSAEERALLALLAEDEAASLAGGKYSKRTISHASSDSNNTSSSSSGKQVSDQTASPSIKALDGQKPQQHLNLTLKAEALIELALKAQYFYYVKFRIGSCLPTKCSPSDVKKLAQTASRRAILQSVQVNCMKKEPFSLNTYQLVAICILTVLALIAILGAIVDLLGYKEDLNSTSAFINWLLPFSIWTNAKRLFDLQAANTHSDLECVHGLRFFSMIWVIYGHTILYMEYQSFTHFYDVIETQIPNFILLPSLNANFSVDTFFVISGILTTYVTWEYTKGDARKFNKFAFMISRYIRLTPQLAIVILCFFLLPLFGDGPMYKQVADDKAEVCYQNWAINLLYLQSYIRAEKICIDPSWWLSIEMSFHVISALVIIVMIQNVRRGMIVNFVVAAVLMSWGAIIHYSHGMAIQYLPSIPQRFEVHQEQTKLFFHRPYPHAASYFIGIALGYVLANKTIKKLTTSQLFQGWTVCAVGLVASLWGSYFWNLGAPYTQLQATLYYNLCQILWPVSIAWIILACSLGHGGFVNSILSARIFVPLGRVTYMTYLSHALIIYYHSARMNITLEPSMLLFTYLFIANTSLALALGVILTVVYESPILNLQKQLFSYLTAKFDPTARGGGAKPTRLVPTANGHHNHDHNHQANGFHNHSHQANGHVGKSAGLEAASNHHDTAIVMDEQNALLENGNKPSINGFQNHFQLIKSNDSALANCLMLDANGDKQKARPDADTDEQRAE